LWDDFVECCFTTNEVKGIRYYLIDDKVYIAPDLLEKADNGFYTTIFGEKKEWLYTKEAIHSVDLFGLRKYWTLGDFIMLKRLESFTDPMRIMIEARAIAKNVLSRSPETLAIVCGPMSTGMKSVPENFKIFARTVYKVGQEMDIFNQLPFEPLFGKVHEMIADLPLSLIGGISQYFIDNFYNHIFEYSGKIWKPHFIHDWTYSTGAKLENRTFNRLGSEITYLEEGYERKLF
jgi:hypothetical protein